MPHLAARPRDALSSLTLRHALWLATAAVVVLLAFAAWPFFHFAAATLRFRYPLDYGEGDLLDEAIRFHHLSDIYRPDLSTGPYLVANYPPLLDLVLRPFLRVYGPAYWYGRLISQASVLVTACALGLVVQAFTDDATAALLSGLSFIAIPCVVFWGQFVRVDPFALALTWVALTWLVRGRQGPWTLAGVGLLLVASAYTRQSYALAGPCASVSWLWFHQRRRTAAVCLAALIGGGGLLLLLALTLATHGGFAYHVIVATLNRCSWGRLAALGLPALSQAAVFVLLGLLAALIARRERPSWGALFVPYLICAVFEAVLAAKVGSYVNYFLELAAACSLGVGLCWAWAHRQPGRQAGLLALLALQALLLGRGNALYRELSSELDHAPAQAELLRMVRRSPGFVLADDEMGLLPLAHKPVYVDPFSMTQLAYEGRWNDRPLAQAIRQHLFSLILLHKNSAHPGRVHAMWTPRLYAAIGEAYTQVAEIPVDRHNFVAVFRPAGSP
ncbi:MAG TPA: hypothetical protein VNE16_08875 [Vicinamibacterales bacterium]|nr:hypothetical protein [Vicinamibacterales bacterium]